MRPNRFVVIVAVVVSAFFCQKFVQAQSISFSTDFDGRGTGSSIRVDYSKPSAGRPSTSTAPSSDSAAVAVQQHLNDRYQEQVREVQRPAEVERLQAEAERARLRNEALNRLRVLQQLQILQQDEPSAVQRAIYTQKVLDLQRQFEATRSSYLAMLPSYNRRLAAAIGLGNVPAPPHPLHYRSILILGMGITPQDAEGLVARHEKNPFNDLPYDDVFAFGTPGTTDLGRVALDHLLGQFEHLSATTMAQIGKLKGATADEVVCHSNGCRVVSVLIETGLLKVGKLRVLGGDNAFLEIDRFKALKQSKSLSEVSLYMLRGDLVPIIDAGWRIFDLMHKINHPLQTFAASHSGDSVYQLLGMTKRPGFNPGADVQVHMLSYPASRNLLTQHLYDNYSRVVKGWRRSGCLDPGGAMSRKCIIY